MGKVLFTTDDWTYQWNEDVTDEKGLGPNGDRTYMRKIGQCAPFPGVRPKDVVDEYLKHLRNHAIGMLVQKNKIGMDTIGFETEHIRVCFSVVKFEEVMRQFLTPMFTDPNTVIVDKEQLEKVVYEGFFRERDQQMVSVAKEILNRMNKYVSVV